MTEMNTGDTGGLLPPAEALDSDEIRNNDGDETVDPPEQWIEPKQDETLDERLADEVPEVSADDGPGAPTEAHDADAGGGLELVPDDAIDRLDTQRHGSERGQVDGTPEDGSSFFTVP